MANAYDSLFDVTQVAQASRLKSMASAKDADALKVAAKQFEAFFLDSMMQSMRGASKGLGEVDWLHSHSTDFFQEMYDQQLSLNLAKGEGFGIADMIEKQFAGHAGAASSKETVSQFVNQLHHKMQQAAASAGVEDAAIHVNQSEDALTQAFDDPVKFVEAIWADAVDVAEKLNLDPKLLIAQAALETGWGKSIIAGESGSSFNLFNIKANSDWLGEKISKNTLEYEDGVAVQKNEPFRSYSSFKNSFMDYFSLLNGSSRYSDALSVSHDPKMFLEGLQDAGYATDPNYANKVYQIYRGDTLTNAIDTMFTR